MSKEILKAGVIGFPLTHTLSPKIHEFWLEKYKIHGEYLRIPINPENLKDEILRLRDIGLRGVNVTIPYKEKVLEICDSITQDVQKIGATNRLHFHASGIIEAHNHDAHGFITHFTQSLPAFKPKSAFIIGAGGAARAIVYALKQFGVTEIYITNRRFERAENLAEEFEAISVEWNDAPRFLPQLDLLVNTTSCGMQGQPELEFSIETLNLNAAVYDIVYQPLQTQLLQIAKARGNKTIDGLGMLLNQAAPAFEAFFGQKVEVDDALKAHILKGLNP